MSFLQKLFGGSDGGSKDAPFEEYNGFRIYPDPVKESAGFRISARIEKDFDGETKTHNLIRADVVAGHEQAVQAILHKCQHVIDQQGDRIF
jgi:hypothetical protein